MKNPNRKSNELIAHSYEVHHRAIYLYIYYKIGFKDEAEDLAHDVFVRLMEYRQLVCEATIKCFLFTIARNLVADYLRRFYKKQEITASICNNSSSYSYDTESEIVANDLLDCEKQKIMQLPLQRRTVYTMSRFQHLTLSEISTRLDLSVRTVESHLFAGRREVRSYMRRCV